MEQKQNWELILDWLMGQPQIVGKYDKPGIYAIWIEGELVYIGCSQNMMRRLAGHLDGMNTNKSHKYKVMNEARQRGYKVWFDVLEELPDDIETLKQREAYFIRLYLPALNTQIPKTEDYHKYTYNRSAQMISLKSILAHRNTINWE